MKPRELPNLTVGNRPTMGPDPQASLGQRTVRWLLACTLGLLVAAGVTASFVAQPSEDKSKTKKPAAASVKSTADRALPAKTSKKPIISELPSLE